MLRKLLHQNINPWQIIAYAAANLTGLLIVGLAIQFFRDASPKPDSGATDTLGTTRYTIISRQPHTTLFGTSPGGLTQAELNNIASQPWADSVAPFIPSGFDVTVSLDFAGRGFSTALFFEGVPEDFIDISATEWSFDPAAPEVAIILPRDYLALYNFGFAPARGLPSLDESTVMMAPLKITVSGNGLSTVLPGKIAGFSDRINTIAVPEDFIKWANVRYAPSGIPEPNRAIVRLRQPGDPEINRYLTSHDMTEASGGEATSRLYYFLTIVTGATIGIGGLVSLLAVGLLLLSVFLLLQKSRDTLGRLIDLGYSHSTLAGHYIRLIFSVNAIVCALAAAGVVAAAAIWQPRLASLGLIPSATWPTLLTLLTVMTAISLLSAAIVSHILRKIWF